PRRVAQVAALDSAVGCDADPGQDVAAEALHQRGAFARAQRNRCCDRAGRQPLQNFIDEREALLDLADADPYSRVDVAGVDYRHLELEGIVGRIAWRAPRIEVAP